MCLSSEGPGLTAKTACTPIWCQDRIALGMLPIDLCEHIHLAKQSEIKDN